MNTDVRKSKISAVLNPEAAPGLLLIFTTLIAFIWANSPWASYYQSFWEMPVAIRVGSFAFEKPLLLWVNDGLMAIFFFVIGLEIKREILEGELASVRKAALPILAAIGGMIVPVLLFSGIMGDQPGSEGWGIPMATDIAFALGILSLLGDRVPLGLKVFLAAFAIVDDIGAILVIAIWYGHGFHATPFIWAVGLYALLLLFNLVFKIQKTTWPYIVVGVGIWFCLLKSGIHPTIAGVLVALAIPSRKKLSLKSMLQNFQSYFTDIDTRRKQKKGTFFKESTLEMLDKVRKEVKIVQPPAQRLEFRLHSFSNFFVMPVFALANAGVNVTGLSLSGGNTLLLAIGVGLVFGKLLGILGFSFLAIKTGLTDMPKGATWKSMVGVAFLGGIGFTMALFIANLALESGSLLQQAKLGILLSSLVATTFGVLLLFQRKKE
jgi:NhaA family Na+:H+ antiporter